MVRQGSDETTVADAEALRQRARSGSLRAHATITDEDGTTRAAAAHPALAGFFAAAAPAVDPWAAWRGVDAVDVSQVYRRMTEDVIPELPAEALEVQGDAGSSRTEARAQEGRRRPPLVSRAVELEPDELTDESVEAIGTPRRVRERPTPATPRASGADIVVFPGRMPGAGETPPPRPRSADASFDPDGLAERGLPPTLDAYFPPRARRPERTTLGGSTFTRLAAFAFALGALGLAGWLWASIAADRPALARRTPGTAGGGASVVASTTPEQAAASLAMRQVEAGLRTRMAPNPRESRTETQLSDALLLDIGQMQVRVRSVKVRVVKYSGRRLDEPRAAEVRVDYLPGEDRARDLGAITLVVGRYARMLRMDLPLFTITDTLGQAVAPTALVVDAFYLGRLDLEKFMAGLVTVPVEAPALPAP